jgi:hypothetical protein
MSIRLKNAIGITMGKASLRDIICGIIIGLIAMAGIFLVESGFSLININAINIARLSIISQSIISNNDTLMRGMYGPEGGIIGIGFRFLVIALTVTYIYLIARKSKKVQL